MYYQEPFKTEEYKHYTIELVADDEPESPREWDNLGTMVCWHRHCKLGDEQPKESPEEWLRDVLERDGKLKPDSISGYYDIPEGKTGMELLCDYNLVIPIMAYEHGDITIKAYDYGNWPDQQWDCGQLGFIYVSHDKIKQEWKVKRLTKAVLEKARRSLLSEIEVYDDYLTGNVCGYQVKDQDGEVIDSCFGFFGDSGQKQALSDARGTVDYQIAEQDSQKWQAFAEQEAANV